MLEHRPANELHHFQLCTHRRNSASYQAVRQVIEFLRQTAEFDGASDDVICTSMRIALAAFLRGSELDLALESAAERVHEQLELEVAQMERRRAMADARDRRCERKRIGRLRKRLDEQQAELLRLEQAHDAPEQPSKRPCVRIPAMTTTSSLRLHTSMQIPKLDLGSAAQSSQ